MSNENSLTKSRPQYAEYAVGHNDEIGVKFGFTFPPELPTHLEPRFTSASLYDSGYNLIKVIDNGHVDIPLADLPVDKLGETDFYLLYQTDFILKDGSSREDIEKILKNCQTTYSIQGGEDGSKEFSLFDTVNISADKKEVFMFKQINLKK